MAVELEIRDGDPWWLSPDVWVVPGADPEGSPGQPIAGSPAYLWARVRNNGSSTATNATVRFYWADPSAGFDRTTAHPIGTSFVTLAPGEVAEVLCLQAWVPEFVNGGHECVLAEAFHDPADPLPPSAAFDVPTDRHVAQLNLSVVQALRAGFFRLPVSLVNTARLERRFAISLEPGEAAQLKPLLPTLGKGLELPKLTGRVTAARLVEEPCAGPDALGDAGPLELAVTIPARTKRGGTLIGRVEGGPTLVHLVQRQGKRVVGGLSVLVLDEDRGKNPARGA